MGNTVIVVAPGADPVQTASWVQQFTEALTADVKETNYMPDEELDPESVRVARVMNAWKLNSTSPTKEKAISLIEVMAQSGLIRMDSSVSKEGVRARTYVRFFRASDGKTLGYLSTESFKFTGPSVPHLSNKSIAGLRQVGKRDHWRLNLNHENAMEFITDVLTEALDD